MRKLNVILLLSLLFWLSPSVGFCSENQTYQISETQLTVLQEHLNALERNNSGLLNLLNASEMDLTETSLSLNESKKELETLRTQLAVLQAETKQLSESLRIANAELQKASEFFKASEKAHAKIEGRLRTQRNVWEAIAAVLAGVCIAR